MLLKTKIIKIILVCLFSYSAFAAEKYTIVGKVTDRETGAPIPGAKIRVQNTSQGTYTQKNGRFRLPFLEGDNTLKISSLGYESEIFSINKDIRDTLLIKLKPAPIKLPGVTIVAPDVHDIISQAIKKKKENIAKIKTFKGLLYSKLNVEINGLPGSVQSSSGGFSLSMGLGADKSKNEKYKMVLLETFSRVMKDYEKNIRTTEIIQRKQTANIDKDNNLFAMGEFFNFYDESIKIINADFITPLSEKAFSYYKFDLIDRTKIDDRNVFIIEVKPETDVYPLFEGTIKIIEGTYDMIELNLKPSEKSAIKFMDSLQFQQKYTEVQKDIWYPTFLETSGILNINVMKGIMDIKAKATITSIYNEAEINVALPDSIYILEKPRTLTVAENADSAKTEFWEKNSMRDISTDELLAYKEIDSLVAADTTKAVSNSFYFDYQRPYIDFNRVGAISLGISPKFYYKSISLELTPYYSFGQKRFFGEAELNIGLINDYRTRLGVNFNLFSKISPLGTEQTYSRIINMLVSSLFHVDYFDYGRYDGWSSGISCSKFGLNLDMNIEINRYFSLSTTTNNSIFSKSLWRINPNVEDGDFRNLYANLSYVIPGLSRYDIFNDITIRGMYGDEHINKRMFRSIYGELNLSFPTFYTGYQPMQMKIKLRTGKSSDNMPFQYLFRQSTKLVFISGFGNFLTPAVAYYGGNEFYAGHFEYNLTDLWWRALGLPLYEGRGLDLMIGGSSAKYICPDSSFYHSTNGKFYWEFGFGLGRIPTFISNVFTLGINTRWGIGPLSAKKFGFALNLDMGM